MCIYEESPTAGGARGGAEVCEEGKCSVLGAQPGIGAGKALETPGKNVSGEHSRCMLGLAQKFLLKATPRKVKHLPRCLLGAAVTGYSHRIMESPNGLDWKGP